MIGLVPASRIPHIPRPVAIIGGAWLVLVAIYGVLGRLVGDAPSLCPFKVITDRPCPTCGATRAAFALFGGHPIEAIALNPLVCLIVTIVFVVLGLRVGFARRVELHLTAAQQRLAWGLVIVAFVVNWLYLVRSGV